MAEALRKTILLRCISGLLRCESAFHCTACLGMPQYFIERARHFQGHSTSDSTIFMWRFCLTRFFFSICSQGDFSRASFDLSFSGGQVDREYHVTFPLRVVGSIGVALNFPFSVAGLLKSIT